MRHFRFHLGTLVILVLLMGVGFAALRESNEIWDSSIFSITLGVLLISILLAIHRTERTTGILAGVRSVRLDLPGASLVPSIESRLITTKALAYLGSKMPRGSLKIASVRHTGSWSLAPSNQGQNLATNAVGSEVTVVGEGRVFVYDRTTGKPLNGWMGRTENFIRIGHSLFALMIGWFGGQLSRRLCRTSRAQESSKAVDVEETTP